MKISRTVRRVVTGALLGLPAALLAHTLAFGAQHTAGAGMHALFLGLASALAFAATLVVAVAAMRRVPGIAPKFAPILAGSALWFAAIEGSEQSHSVPVLVSALALVVASFIVRTLLRAFAETVVAFARALWYAQAERKPLCAHAIREATPAHYRPAYRFRVFSRPPPVLS